METPKIRSKHGPEYHIQADLVKFLEARGWLVERLVGMAWQVGIPDLYVAHSKYGCRWIDVKNPVSYTFTKAQKIKWPIWEANGVGIWILTGATEEEYDKLFFPPNWRNYWKKSYEDEMNPQLILDAEYPNETN